MDDRGLGLSYQNLVRFIRHMVQEHGWDLETVLHCLDTPWRWREEMQEELGIKTKITLTEP